MAFVSGGHSRTSDRAHRARRRRVFARDGHECQIRGPHCTGNADELDHVIPLAEGGPDTDENTQAACSPCHKAKSRREAIRGRRRQAATAYHPREPHPGIRTRRPSPTPGANTPGG